MMTEHEVEKRSAGEGGRRAPERTCAGCGRHAAAGDLLRFVQMGDEVVVDVRGSGLGRGAHVHPTLACLVKACKGGFSRSFKGNVKASAEDLSDQIHDAYDRRITGLLTAARRAGHLAIGQEAACEALRGAKAAELVVVATDAGSIVHKDVVARAIAEGRAVAWKDKGALGALFGRQEVGIVAVTEPAIAAQIIEARSRSEACKGREER